MFKVDIVCGFIIRVLIWKILLQGSWMWMVLLDLFGV